MDPQIKKDMSTALISTVASQDRAAVQALLEKGADPAADNSRALQVALLGNDPALADLMVRHGAYVWRAIAGLQGRPLKEEMSERVGIWLALEAIYRSGERQPARQMHEDAFRVTYGDYKTLADLQVERYGQKVTGLTLAARAGMIDEIFAFALPDPADRLTADAFFAKDGNKQSVVDVLCLPWLDNKAAAEALSPLFNEKFWLGRDDEAIRLWEGMPARVRPLLDKNVPALRFKRNLTRLDALKLPRRPSGPGK